MQKTALLKTNTRFLQTVNWIHLEELRPTIALLFLFFFSLTTVLGFLNQYQFGILFNFSFGNTIIIALSALYFITISQYFLLRDTAFWCYGLYLVCNICYFHYTIFMGNIVFLAFSNVIHGAVGYLLIGGYYLYILFTIHFLNLKKDYPAFHKRMILYAQFFLLLLCIYTFFVFFIRDPYTWQLCLNSVIFCCIPISLWGITDCFITLKGRLERIFLLGTSCYLVGSVLGFLIGSRLFTDYLSPVWVKNWTFFTQTGTLLETIFFSSGLAYRMRLIEIQKNTIEQELLKEKVKELEVQHALLKQRERISHDLHDDVGGTLNSISVFSELARLQIQHIHPEASPMLERIGEASRDLVTTINDIVWAVNPKNDQFENIILRMRLFAADLLMPKNVDLDFQTEEQLNAINLSVDKRKQFYLVFKEAVNNIYKYAQCSVLKIQIERSGENICMTITDNGTGFDLSCPKNGNGLQSMHERAKILRGVLLIDSQLNKGTRLHLCFPIDDKDLDKQP
jgi:signal transduction histidine kinase